MMSSDSEGGDGEDEGGAEKKVKPSKKNKDEKSKDGKQSVDKLERSKVISKHTRFTGGMYTEKEASKKGVASKGMHGATVVPEAAFLKHRKLLEKKKRN